MLKTDRKFGFNKELVDDPKKGDICAECGKRIDGRQWWDLKNNEFICEDCRDEYDN